MTGMAGRNWKKSQESYERSELYANMKTELVNLQHCQEVYERLPKLAGHGLDVGGGYGLVRYFLPADSKYLCLDPWPEAMIQAYRLSQNNAYVKAFPFIRDSFAFVCSHGERLPLLAQTFDWVHMRSVLDHFADPYEALKEAWRVLKSGGYLVIGVAAVGGPTNSRMYSGGCKGLITKVQFKYHQEGWRGVVQSAGRRLLRLNLEDPHMWRPSISQLRALLNQTGFTVVWEHWTKPPYDHVVYILASKKGWPLSESTDPIA
jgi:ubiquinone/menaquinone biosynthesis C-methylase UbiE